MLSTSTRNLKASSGGIRDSSERRQHVRYSFTATLEAFEPESQTRIQGRTADLSSGGCYVDMMSPFPDQTRLNVRITREARSFECRATVVYSVTGMGMGLRFDAIDPRQLPILKDWLAELSGESTSEPRIENRPDSGGRSTNANAVLNELVSELMRKGVLAQDMSQGMLSLPTT
jgi:hypothetical protein